ncbi:hypothetical protein RR46_00469 [Papilio xuthus]|uniref:Uncharacterized protein n=1 Tax=Papilio xuthus TaxID=66420 RepID=A0A0N1PGA7_PAPXU|nr:hypothetical protein RR46_00469 [Papilio xuthus]
MIVILLQWITPEECAVYSRERRPPLVIPRITQYRAPRRDIRQQNFTGHTYECLNALKSRRCDNFQYQQEVDICMLSSTRSAFVHATNNEP